MAGNNTAKRKVTFGLKNLTVWFEGDDYEEAVSIPGIISYNRTMNTSTADLYADDGLYYRYNDEKNGDSTMSLADLPDEVKARMLGWRIDANGGLVHVKDAKPERFHMAYNVSSDTHDRRKFVYGCEASVASDNNETRGESMSFRNEEATITEYGIDLNGEHVWDYTVNRALDPEGYAKSFDEVVFPSAETASPSSGSAALSALSIGSLTLSPAFAAETTAYTATTSNATNAVTATAASSGATVAIAVNDTAVENGASATWQDGENTVSVTVTNGSATRTYTVTVTKSE